MTTSNTCGCCRPPVQPTPVTIYNRPGLSALAYRVGTFASFREAMIEAIARTPELDRLRTRRSDDYAITILDLWATVADILTFYQERIANDAFLRTARYRDSVLRLARLLDYQLRPGVAATAYLAFTVEKGKKVHIPVGLPVQSVPGQNEKPVKFETMEEITADARWNRLRILPAPVPVTSTTTLGNESYLHPGANSLALAAELAPGDRILFFMDSTNDPVQSLLVQQIRVEDDHVIISWKMPAKSVTWDTNTCAFKTARQFRLFGYNVPDTYYRARFKADKTFDSWEVAGDDLRVYPHTPDESQEVLCLDGLYHDLKTGGRLIIADDCCNRLVTITKIDQGHNTLGPLSDTVSKVSISPALSSFPNIKDRRKVIVYELVGSAINFWDHGYPPQIKAANIYISGRKIDEETIEISRTIEGNAFVEGIKISLKEIEPGRKVILIDNKQIPVLATIINASINASLETVESNYPPDYLRLSLQTESEITLDTASAVLLGNVALVSHGETVKEEIVGDGDASAKFQRFDLKKKPVTYVSSGSSGGVENTLKVLVNNALWKESPSLYGRAPTEQVYTTRISDDGTTSIQFGDGLTGVRLSSGRGNVVARYRQGSGLSGRVRANTLTTLLQKPIGLKAATNPAPAEGGADPETLDQARTNAPATVRTFGRAVSIRDFEDLSRSSGEVAKARATWVWNGWKRAVHLTVAGQKGSVFSKDALTRIYSSLTAQRDPNHALFLDNYKQVPVVIWATIGVDDRYIAVNVKTGVSTALLEALSFEKLEFGMPLHLSDIYKIMQDVSGVVWVDINLFHFKDRTAAHLNYRGACYKPVQKHLRIYPARPNPVAPFEVLPAEQACIEVPTQDIIILTSGGLPQ